MNFAKDGTKAKLVYGNRDDLTAFCLTHEILLADADDYG
jgi:hypothetical protein